MPIKTDGAVLPAINRDQPQPNRGCLLEREGNYPPILASSVRDGRVATVAPSHKNITRDQLCRDIT
jgi:hypothetical protein